MQIANHAFLVTGGVSGLGAATVRRLVEAGGHALILDLDGAGGRAIESELGSRVRFRQADVTDEAAVGEALAVAQEAWGAVHGVVSCAGIAPGERVLGRGGPHGLDTFRRAIEINLIGTFNVLRLAAAAMASNSPDANGERGVIVNTASIAAFEGQVGQVAYSASKAGVAGLTLPAARELARAGIRVMAIAPGAFDTPMVASFAPELQQSVGAQVPFPARLGRPEEFAALVEHIVVNPMLNGTVIRLDGALRLPGR